MTSLASAIWMGTIDFTPHLRPTILHTCLCKVLSSRIFNCPYMVGNLTCCHHVFKMNFYAFQIGAIQNSTEYTLGVLKNARVNTGNDWLVRKCMTHSAIASCATIFVLTTFWYHLSSIATLGAIGFFLARLTCRFESYCCTPLVWLEFPTRAKKKFWYPG